MLEKNPRCAFCGGEVGGKGSIVMKIEFVMGKPRVGWCGDCSMKDDVPRRIRGARHFQDVDASIYEVGRRGHGRVLFEEVAWEASRKTQTSSPCPTASPSGCRERTRRTRSPWTCS